MLTDMCLFFRLLVHVSNRELLLESVIAHVLYELLGTSLYTFSVAPAGRSGLQQRRLFDDEAFVGVDLRSESQTHHAGCLGQYL